MSNGSLITVFSKCRRSMFENLLSTHRLRLFQQKRFRKYKQKWASNLKPKTHSELALQHFDIFYSKFYGQLWPSIRISLLSQQKYCALLNNYDSILTRESELILQNLGARNFTALSNDLTDELNRKQITEKRTNDNEKILVENLEFRSDDSDIADPLADKTVMFSDSTVPIDEKNTSLYDFVPTEKVYTSKELLKLEVIKQSTFEAHDIPINFITENIPKIPETLKVFCFDRGNIDTFPAPNVTRGSNKLGYFMMDAASVLPVIALDLQQEDNILDMCSAPGGKMLTMLQYPFSGKMVCNDTSNSRLYRLSRILDSYGNQSMIERVEVHQSDGTVLKEPQFDKVLVDVPCTTDRHSLLVDDNNIFKPGRIQERIELPNIQKNLLVSGMMSCVPGGYVVYSTCSLSPAQNDGVIQSALEHVWKETNIDFTIVDLSYMQALFDGTFDFFSGCRFGQLVLPTLTANFGPMYLCKLKRIK